MKASLSLDVIKMKRRYVEAIANSDARKAEMEAEVSASVLIITVVPMGINGNMCA